jgi:hypothetical protein
MKHAIKAVVVALAAAVVVSTNPVGADAGPRRFANCTAMHKVYKHGVGKRGAHDHTSGTRVTNFYRNNALYRANSKSDRDKDGIACEQR